MAPVRPFNQQKLINEGFNTSIDDSIELVGAELNPGTGVGELRLLGGEDNWPFGKTWEISGDFSDSEGIVNASIYVPTLNTGDPNDEFDDSAWDSAKNEIVNAHLPVDRSQGQTRIDFFKLGLGLDDIIADMSQVPLAYSIGDDKVSLDATLLDADLEAYLGIAQEMTFDPTIMVDLNFLDANNQPRTTFVETTPGSGIFEAVTTKRIGLDQDIEIIHSGGTLNVDTDYVLSFQLRRRFQGLRFGSG